MPEYRRNRIPGGTYFFTVNLHDRGSRLLVDRIDLLRAAVRRVRTLRPFQIEARVALPDHMHCLWTLPEGDTDYSYRWQSIKMAFSKAVPPGEARAASWAARGERGIWQRRFWEHTIRNDEDSAFMWITSMTTPSGTAWSGIRAIGHIRRSARLSPGVDIRRIG